MSSRYDYMQGSVGSLVRGVIYRDNNIQELDPAQDTVNFKWWFESDPNATRMAPGTIVTANPEIVEYVTQLGDLDQSGVLWGQWEINAVSLGWSGPSQQIRYEIGPLIGP